MILYDLILCIYLLAIAPKLAIDRLRGKRHPAFLQRLGFFLPRPEKEEVFWLHAPSVGEIKSASSFFFLLKKNYPEAWICITATTATGLAEAKRSLKGADCYLYAPLDFSLSCRKFVQRLRPSAYFLVESDLWPQLLKTLHKYDIKSFLLSGKFSKRAASRWKFIPTLAKGMFSCFTRLCMQSEEMAERLLPFVSDRLKIFVLGNFKLDNEPALVTPLDLPSTNTYLTISCTHAPEEEMLLDRLKEGPWTIFLAPRHPERFFEVGELLRKKKISFIRWGEIKNFTGEKVILVDAMGQLSSCYARSSLAIVCGSFIPHIGGHNVFEPCLYGCPSLFGPYTFTQRELVQKVIEAGAGRQVDLEGIEEAVSEVVAHREKYATKAARLVLDARGASLAAWETIFPLLQKN